MPRRSRRKGRGRVMVMCGAEPFVERMRANTVRSLIPRSCGVAVRCVSGVVVVTQEGDRDDHELYPGDEFRSDGRGLVVTWAVSESEVAVGMVAREDVRQAA